LLLGYSVFKPNKVSHKCTLEQTSRICSPLMYNVRALPWLLVQKQYLAGKAGAAWYTQLHFALFMVGVRRIQEFYAKHTRTGFIPRAARVGIVMNLLALGPRTFCQSMIPPGPPCTFIYHKRDRNCPIGRRSSHGGAVASSQR
jgi:hypothetical protein